MNTFKIANFIFLSLLIFSCKKHDHTEDEPPIVATISISNPSENDTIQGNFNLQGSITASGELHGYHLLITNDSDQSVVYETEAHDHATSFNFNQMITHSFTSYAHLTLKIETTTGHDGNTTEKNVHFVVH